MFHRIACASALAVVVVACSSTTSGTGSSSSSSSSGSGASSSGAGGSLGSCDPHVNGGSGCVDGAECIAGTCLARTETACRLNDDNDGCDEGSFCFQGREGLRCYRANPCPDNGICPAPNGSYAACNEDGALPSKGRICLPGRCRTSDDCTNGFACMRQRVSDLLGTCDFAGVDSSNGSGTVWMDGCALGPSKFSGTKPPGGACSDPYECKPVCCSCDGGKAVQVVACDLDRLTCRSAAETCSEATYNTQVCTLP